MNDNTLFAILFIGVFLVTCVGILVDGIQSEAPVECVEVE